jgi:1-phosphatidylinositol phosphodiesterase
LYYDRVEATIHSFLQEHPTETVLVQVFDREDVFTFDNLNFLNQTIYKHTDWYYQTPGIPKLNECAGKMILAHRFSLDRSDGVVIPPCGIDVSSWPNIIDNNSNLIGIVQDDWNCGNPKYKWNHNVYPLINTPPQPNNDKDFIFINCLNATGSPFNYGPLPDPKLMAKQINDAFLKTTLTYKNWYGWYLFDSHKNDLSSDINIAHKLYVTNEFFS